MFETTDTALRDFLYKRGHPLGGFSKMHKPERFQFHDTPELRAHIREFEGTKRQVRSRPLNNRSEVTVRTPEELFAALTGDSHPAGMVY
jgi:hypothetical protein